jgi:hypothetical protein
LWGYGWIAVNVNFQLHEALAAVQEAIATFGSLAEQTPQRFAPALAAAYATLADLPDRLGHANEAAEIGRQTTKPSV